MSTPNIPESSLPDINTLILDAEKAIMLELWDRISKHRTAELFMYPVTNAEAPGYSKKIREPMDLTTVKYV